ncbi:Hsp20/alpha crystallin family protein [Ancylomarina longa]|uniref:Hsp20/alpha crystallin family protein n=1 Tax=Ancylomarina longa TaxID=2487017 RepID=A0A434AGF6_9BACT|nr:Hsp20/alpha crystallin family protein [Ancylomarina longa]RUT73452.1 Hsp20/alpha crystallin family protein [Ancylomarina longa]
MTLVRKNSENIFPSLFDNFFSRDWMDWTNSNYSSLNTTLPAINVRENKKEFVIELAAPGMSKEDFKINLENDQLSISSQKKEEKETKDAHYSRKEFSYQSFQRSFQLPMNKVDSKSIVANYKNGILFVQLPKKEKVITNASRVIEIL